VTKVLFCSKIKKKVDRVIRFVNEFGPFLRSLRKKLIFWFLLFIVATGNHEEPIEIFDLSNCSDSGKEATGGRQTAG